jgi:hypothetical protein
MRASADFMLDAQKFFRFDDKRQLSWCGICPSQSVECELEV